jgi:hypothetical protein
VKFSPAPLLVILAVWMVAVAVRWTWNLRRQ